MAITYFVQQENSYVAYGLAADTKPTTMPDNCLFIEVDTAFMYVSLSNAWVIKTTGANLSLSDITNNNATTSRHGFFPKLPTALGKYLRDDLTWQTISGAVTFVDQEVPTGTIDGSNPTFLILNVPLVGSVKLYLNGLRLKSGLDYTLSSLTITMTTIPYSGDVLLADYRY